jgi:hypothetical protein
MCLEDIIKGQAAGTCAPPATAYYCHIARTRMDRRETQEAPELREEEAHSGATERIHR